MTQASYKAIGGPGGHLAHCRPFTGNTMHAEWNDGVYEVTSYRTIIAAFNPLTGVYVSEQHFSRTTSRHQGLCRAWLATAVRVMVLDEVDFDIKREGN